MKRRLRLDQRPHARFWEVSVNESVITIHAGLEHTPGTVRRIERPSPEAARLTVEQLIAQRVADGFQEAPLDASAESLMPTSDDAPWLVYADTLLSQGDVRGELIGHHVRGDAKRANSLLRTHGEALLGELNGVIKQVELTWVRGFISSARVTSEPRRRHVVPLETVVRALFNSPSIRMLQRLELGWPGARYDEALWALGDLQWPMHLDTLEIGSFDPTVVKQWPTLASLRPVQWRKQLRYLVVRASMSEMQRLQHHGLRHLELDGPALTHRVFADVLESDLPSLKGLVLNVGAESVMRARHLTPLASTRFMPELAALGVRQCQDATTFAQRLIESGRLHKLALLDLSENGLNEHDGKWLVENARHFAHLTRLVLRRNRFKPRMVSKLAGALPHADLTEQQ